MAEAVNIKVDEAVLVQQAQKGDSAATERLILKYQDRIYNVILKICANPEDAAELAQETFVKVIENISKFEARSSFYTWVFRIAVNLTLNYCKRTGRLRFSSLDAEQQRQDAQVRTELKQFLNDKSSPDPAVVAQNRELCRLIMKALMELDDAHRTVIVLRDIENMNYAQIADVLDTELGTVKSRLSRARSNLREIMEAFL